jgi:hypothetical protein
VADVERMERQPAADDRPRVGGHLHEIQHHVVDRVVGLFESYKLSSAICQINRRDAWIKQRTYRGRVAVQEGDEPAEHEQRKLVLHHEHVAADVREHVHLAVPAEDRVVSRVVTQLAVTLRRLLLLRLPLLHCGLRRRGGSHHLEQEAPVQEHHLQEPVPVATPGVEVHVRLLQLLLRLRQRRHQAPERPLGAPEEVEQGALLVRLHGGEVRVVVVERAQGHQVRPVRLRRRRVPDVRRHAVDGLLQPLLHLLRGVAGAILLEQVLHVHHPIVLPVHELHYIGLQLIGNICFGMEPIFILLGRCWFSFLVGEERNNDEGLS